MQVKRMRMFAGPNGSGKSTIFNRIKEKVDFGFYLNADDIELRLNDKGFVDLYEFIDENIEPGDFEVFIERSSLRVKALSQNLDIKLTLKSNQIISDSNLVNSYEASIIVSFIRELLLSKGCKFTFETVMSHSSKIDTLKKSKELGYKNYLYFISTDDVELNVVRVKDRVFKGGHSVDEGKIRKRYINSLELLHKAVPYTQRTYIFDNSGDVAKLILEVFNNEEIKFYSDAIPEWVNRWLLSYLQ